MKKFQSLNKLFFFIFFFFVIFISRTLFINFSLGSYPWYYEWQHLEYFIKLKDSDLSFIFSHSLRNQFQIFTKLIYLIFFYLSDYLWLPKIWTIIVQIVPAFTLALVITFLFYEKVRSYWLILGLILFSIFPSSLSNFYHLSESHFYFQLLIIILSFLVYEKYDGLKSFILIFLLAILSIFNMAAVSIILFLTFSGFFLLKFFLKKNNKDLFYSIIIFVSTLIYYYISYQLKISSIYETSSLAGSTVNRSLYLIFKGFFHQNNIIFGLFLFLTLIVSVIKKDYFFDKYIKNNSFFVLLILFSILTIISISAGKTQIYDRYKDFFQIFGYLSFFLYSELPVKKFYRYFLGTLIGIVIIYNSLFFLDKFNEIKIESKNYNLSIDIAINKYKNNNTIILREHLHEKAKRFPSIIMNAVDNRLF